MAGITKNVGSSRMNENTLIVDGDAKCASEINIIMRPTNNQIAFLFRGDLGWRTLGWRGDGETDRELLRREV